MASTKQSHPEKPIDTDLSRTIGLEELDESIARVDERVDRMQGRWILALAVANSAGLTALGAKTFDNIGGDGPAAAREGALLIALPSLWLFAIGISAAALAHVGEQTAQILAARRLRRGRALLVKSGPKAQIQMGPFPFTAWSWIKLWFWEGVSGFAFIAGLAYPLTVLSIRYHQSGGGFGLP